MAGCCEHGNEDLYSIKCGELASWGHVSFCRRTVLRPGNCIRPTAIWHKSFWTSFTVGTHKKYGVWGYHSGVVRGWSLLGGYTVSTGRQLPNLASTTVPGTVQCLQRC